MSDYELTAELDRRAADRLREIIASHTDASGVCDSIKAHFEADEMLCAVLVGEGYAELVDVFKGLKKWYG